jgi:hypothetical protein
MRVTSGFMRSRKWRRAIIKDPGYWRTRTAISRWLGRPTRRSEINETPGAWDQYRGVQA